MMSDKYKGKYRIKSTRLQNWDYSWSALYFVTICTQNREFYFGDIAKNQMILSAIGKIAKRYWYKIPKHYPFVELDEFVVMPNHIHGIIIINNSDDKDAINPNGRDAIHGVCTNGEDIINPNNRDAIHGVCTDVGGITGHKNPMLSNGLSRIIRWYKGRVSFESRKIHADFAWQARFHDHIIRNEESFQRIRNYIHNNPLKWKADKFSDDAES